MPQRSPRQIAATFLVVGTLGCLAYFWVDAFVREFRLAEARSDLFVAIEGGDMRMVLESINRIDPSGRGSSESWFSDEELPSRSGFESLQLRWMKAGHRHGADQLFNRWHPVDPLKSREAILTHLLSLSDQGAKEDFLVLFKTGLAHAIKDGFSTQDTSEIPILSFTAQNPELSLIAWLEFDQAGRAGLLPDRIKTNALDRSNFGDPSSFKKILQITGLLEPVTTFVVEPSTVQTGGRRLSWIEELYDSLSNEGVPEFERAREELRTFYPDGTGPETPGMHVLLLLLDSPILDKPGLLPPGKVESGIDTFDRMPSDSKAEFAAVIDALIPAYGENWRLRDWVWTHHQAAWESRGAALKNLVGPGDYGTWESPDFRLWIREAMKYGQAERTTNTIRHVRSLHLIRKTNQVPTGETINERDHPFSLSAEFFAIRPGEGTDFLPGTFDLLLALGKDPMTPPGHTFPTLKTMVYGDTAEVPFRPWEEFSAAQFHEWVTALGERYVDDPVRFLIVPSFGGEESGLTPTLGKPAALAELQRLAAEETRRGGWLAKDLAELFPRWFIHNRKDHDALIAAGGHGHSFDRVEAYLRDQRAPVASRVSYLLGILDWINVQHSAKVASSLGTQVSRFPGIGELASEFTSDLDLRGSLSSNTPLETWRLIIESWMPDPVGPANVVNESALRSARGRLVARFDALLDQRLSVVPDPTPADSNDLKSLTPVLGLYANLLRLDGRHEVLAGLQEQIDGRVPRPQDVFTWVDNSIRDPSLTAAKIVSENYDLADQYRSNGWESVKEALASTDYAHSVLALSETTALLEFSEWIEFCQNAIDFLHLGKEPAAQEFFTLPPALFLKSSRNLSPEFKRQHLLDALKGVAITDEQAPFFLIALPPLFHQYVRTREEAFYLSESLRDGGTRLVDPVIIEAFATEANRTLAPPGEDHVKLLRDPRIPLAQRWIAANYFLLPIRSMDRPPSVGDPAIQIKQRITFFETGVELLTEAVQTGLPVWELPQRAFGEKTANLQSVGEFVSSYSVLLKNNHTVRHEPGHALLEDQIIDALLRDCPDRRRLLSALHEIALLLDDHEAASYLFVLAERDLNFETQVGWLSRWNDPPAVARHFREKWQLSGGLNAFRHFTISEEDIRSILMEIGDDPDLVLLARSFMSPRPFLSSAICGETRPQIPGVEIPTSQTGEATLVNQFTAHSFKDPEKERLCLGHLPVKPHQALLLAPWLETRLEGHDFQQSLIGPSKDFHSMWPYWSRQIQSLAAAGKYDSLARMIPEGNWFSGNRGHSSRYDTINGSTIEETVWVGFAVALGHRLNIHDLRSHPALGDMIARLIANPPVSNGPDSIGQHPASSQANEPWVFRRLSLESLSHRATANLLVATLDDPAERAISETRRFSPTPGPARIGDRMTVPLRYLPLFQAIADYPASLTKERRQQMFLRACETATFTEHAEVRDLPFSSILNSILPESVTRVDLTNFARARLAENPDSPSRQADLGLVLMEQGVAEEAEKLLKSSALLLSQPENLSAFRKVDRALVKIRSRKGVPR